MWRACRARGFKSACAALVEKGMLSKLDARSSALPLLGAPLTSQRHRPAKAPPQHISAARHQAFSIFMRSAHSCSVRISHSEPCFVARRCGSTIAKVMMHPSVLGRGGAQISTTSNQFQTDSPNTTAFSCPVCSSWMPVPPMSSCLRPKHVCLDGRPRLCVCVCLFLQ